MVSLIAKKVTVDCFVTAAPYDGDYKVIGLSGLSSYGGGVTFWKIIQYSPKSLL